MKYLLRNLVVGLALGS